MLEWLFLPPLVLSIYRYVSLSLYICLSVSLTDPPSLPAKLLLRTMQTIGTMTIFFFYHLLQFISVLLSVLFPLPHSLSLPPSLPSTFAKLLIILIRRTMQTLDSMTFLLLFIAIHICLALYLYLLLFLSLSLSLWYPGKRLCEQSWTLLVRRAHPHREVWEGEYTGANPSHHPSLQSGGVSFCLCRGWSGLKPRPLSGPVLIQPIMFQLVSITMTISLIVQ